MEGAFRGGEAAGGCAGAGLVMRPSSGASSQPRRISMLSVAVVLDQSGASSGASFPPAPEAPSQPSDASPGKGRRVDQRAVGGDGAVVAVLARRQHLGLLARALARGQSGQGGQGRARPARIGRSTKRPQHDRHEPRHADLDEPHRVEAARRATAPARRARSPATLDPLEGHRADGDRIAPRLVEAHGGGPRARAAPRSRRRRAGPRPRPRRARRPPEPATVRRRMAPGSRSTSRRVSETS